MGPMGIRKFIMMVFGEDIVEKNKLLLKSIFN